MSMTICKDFEGCCASMGVHIVVDSCVTQSQDMFISKDIKIVCYPPNYTSMLQNLELGIIKCSRQLSESM